MNASQQVVYFKRQAHDSILTDGKTADMQWNNQVLN